MEKHVIDYRLYFLSADGKHIDRFEPVRGISDDDAIEASKIYIGGQPLELWRREQRIHSFPAR